MAKKTTQTATAEHTSADWNVDQVELKHVNDVVSFGNLPEKSREYLIRLGFSTALKNAHTALTGKAATAAWKAWNSGEAPGEVDAKTLAVAAEDYGVEPHSHNNAESFVKAIVAAQETDMFDRLVSGDVNRTRGGGGGRRDELEKLIDKLALAAVIEYAKGRDTLDRITAKKTDPDDVRASKSALRAKAVVSWRANNLDILRAAAEKILAEEKNAAGTADGMEDLGI